MSKTREAGMAAGFFCAYVIFLSVFYLMITRFVYSQIPYQIYITCVIGIYIAYKGGKLVIKK
jgi:hypothetical protein